MRIIEKVKSFLKQPVIEPEKMSSEVPIDNVQMDLSNDIYPNTGSFFDNEYSTGLFGKTEVSDIVFKQKQKIMTYRQLALNPEVAEGIDEIVNEIIFSFGDDLPVKLDMNEENEKIEKAISEKFEKICNLLNIKRNFYQIVKRSYIDGQIVLHCAYDKKSTKNGIESIKLVEPSLMYFDSNNKTFKYIADDRTSGIRTGYNSLSIGSLEYSIEEIVREDFGLYDNNINLSYLEYAIKTANILQTLEDLLVPMRFSRSISRRVFNVDIGDLPAKRGAEVMRDYQNKFKYKKFYNNETGEVSNQQHITSMVEDYWFANRSGGKGTSVDVLDESGNLGELDDILYFSKKLYKAMKIPSSRLSGSDDTEFDFTSTRTSKEDVKFFMFISRIRQVYSNVLKELLKREVISSGVMTADEWEERESSIKIKFINDNSFVEKMKLDNFTSKLDIFASTQDYQGKLFSVRTVLKDVFGYNDEEIEQELKNIQKESKDPLFSNFYKESEF